LALGLHLPAAAIFVAGALAYRHQFRARRQPADAALSFGLLIGAFSQLPLPVPPGLDYAAGVTLDEFARLAFTAIVLGGMVVQVGTDARRLARADRDLQRLHQAELERKALADRERLAREIHDGIAQDLWLAKLTYGQLRTRLPQQADLDELGALVDDVLDEAVAGTRQAIAWTQGAAISATPFGDALVRLGREMSNRFDVDITVDAGAVPALDPPVEIELLRITQEALRNAVKHARASQVSVSLAATGGRLSIAIEDDGTGFDEAEVRPGGFGLQTMRRRAELIGGRLSLATSPAYGTRIVIELPTDAAGSREQPPRPGEHPQVLRRPAAQGSGVPARRATGMGDS
jgi:signal transduction histidine kinase